jgi:solute carrier family 35 protein F5
MQDADAAHASLAEGRMLLFGDFIALLAAGFYGCYTTLLKLRIHHESRVDMALFFGYVGLYCLIFLWPFIIVLSVLGIEPFELPPSKTVTFFILVRTLSMPSLISRRTWQLRSSLIIFGYWRC